MTRRGAPESAPYAVSAGKQDCQEDTARLLVAICYSRRPGLAALDVVVGFENYYPCPRCGLGRGLRPSARIDEFGDWTCEACRAEGTTALLRRLVSESRGARRALAGVAA